MVFHIGQKVTMKRAVKWGAYYKDGTAAPDTADFCSRNNIVLPQYSVIYTIRDIYESVCIKECVLHLEEIRNGAIPDESGNSYEPGFAARYFRPVRTTNIDIFRSMLNKLPTGRQLEDA